MPETATAGPEAVRGRRKSFYGVVSSDKMDKTRIVTVDRSVRHPRYKKIVRESRKFSVHDEKNESHAGDFVEIVGARPLSKTKRWRLARIVRPALREAAVKAS